MSEPRSQEECARYILCVLKKFKADAGYVLFDPHSIPELRMPIQNGDFKRGIEYAIDKKWLIKERSMWRLTMTGFAEISYDEADLCEATKDYLIAKNLYEKSSHRKAVERIVAKWCNDANQMLEQLIVSRRTRS